MREDIVTFGWGEEFLVPDDFDLNTLRRLRRVKEIAGCFILDEERNTSITIKLNQPFRFGEENELKLKATESKNEADQYKRWYNDEVKKTKALQEEINALKEKVKSVFEEPEEEVTDD